MGSKRGFVVIVILEAYSLCSEVILKKKFFAACFCTVKTRDTKINNAEINIIL
jgi:hypothetical protein